MAGNQSPLNTFRYCPKCGSEEFQTDSEKSLKCNDCGFRYYVNMNAAVAAIIQNDKGEILFTIRKHEPATGMLDLPGGFVDLDETAEEAVKREILEELNLEISSMEYFGSFTNKYLFADIEYLTLDLVYICTVASFSTLQAADDVSGFVFRQLSEVQSREIGLASIRKVVKMFLMKPDLT